MKYPRIPHLPFSNITDSDDLVTNKNIFNKTWILTEKVDGSQLSAEFDGEEIKVFNRNTPLLHGGMDRQFSPLPSWISRHHDALRAMLGDGTILFGEWMFHVHTVVYSCLPDVFIAFDLYDKKKKSFIPFEEAMQACSVHGFKTVPIIAKTIIRDKEHLLSFVGKSAFSNREMEGIVLHSIDGKDRVKYVTPAFKESVDKARHWKTCERTRNIKNP